MIEFGCINPARVDKQLVSDFCKFRQVFRNSVGNAVRTSIDVAPASREFSINSFTLVAKSRITWPEQMR